MPSPSTSLQEKAPANPQPWWHRALWWIVSTAGLMCRVLLLAWGTLALYWSGLPGGPWLRIMLSAGFVAFGVWCLWRTRSRLAFGLFAAVFGLLLVGWAFIRPSHDRVWREEVKVMPRAVMEGDRVTLRGVRNFAYRSRDDFTEHYEERVVDLKHLQAVDLFISQWSDVPIAHTFVSFIFDNALPVCISIEARLEKGEKYSPVASCFKEAELIYVVGDERDIVGVRAQHRNERVLLYRTTARHEGAKRLFLSYLEKINELADKPEFYHLLSNNCTVNIARHAYREGHGRGFDLRLLVNGYVDALVYAQGALDTSIPLQDLRSGADISHLARTAVVGPDFSTLIRANLRTPPAK